MADQQQIESTQDALRSIRQFVGMIGGAVAGYEGATAYSDYGTYNVPGGYQVIGPNGVAVEGTPYMMPIQATPGGGVYISPMLVLIGIGVAVAMAWKH